jgi:hypothetical protein
MPETTEQDTEARTLAHPVVVLNMATGQQVTYVGIAPEVAVLCAYAQYTRNDYNTWEYRERYGSMRRTGVAGYYCGDWAVPKWAGGAQAPQDRSGAP